MSNRGAIGFGGFLLGLGAGYLLFRELNLTFNSAAWVLIIIGAAIILSAVMRAVDPGLGVHRIIGGLAGGLIFALFLTQGINFFTGLIVNNGSLPYSTTEIKTYTGVSTLDAVYLRLGNMNGQITLSTWDSKEYSITSTITARGSTQKDADDNLANLQKDLTKSETASLQSLTLIYTSPIILNNPYQINIEVKLPATAKLDLDLTTSNGRVTVSNVNGGNITIDTTNGALYLTNVKADTMRGVTSNGQITATVEATTCDLSTSNSPITLKISSTMSGTYTFQTSNGNVDITVGVAAEYKIDATTSNGEVTFSIPNLTYSRDTKTSKVAQTLFYGSVLTNISVNIQTSNASVTVRQSVAGV